MATLGIAPRRHCFTREEYHAMAGQGVFDHQRVELIRGEILDKSPQLSRHAALVNQAQVVIERALGPSCAVRVQLLLSIGGDSEPEPDIAVVAGSPLDYFEAHPVSALLLLEVADSSLDFDLGEKAALYAEA